MRNLTSARQKITARHTGTLKLATMSIPATATPGVEQEVTAGRGERQRGQGRCQNRNTSGCYKRRNPSRSFIAVGGEGVAFSY